VQRSSGSKEGIERDRHCPEDDEELLLLLFLRRLLHTLLGCLLPFLLLFDFDVSAAAFRFCCSRHTPYAHATAATQILNCVCCLLLLLSCLPPPPPPPLLPCC